MTRTLAIVMALALAVAVAAEAKTVRSPAVPRAFQATNPCPSTARTTGACPGYIRDHIVPLCKGGPDTPANLQWQTVEAAKAKDKVECRR